MTKGQIGLGAVDNLPATELRDRTTHTGTQTASTISGFSSAVSSNSDVTANAAARHTHANKATLDAYTQTEATLADAVAKKHSPHEQHRPQRNDGIIHDSR